jgi:UDP-N-acetylmuramoylalanine--D-glutamate ligase
MRHDLSGAAVTVMGLGRFGGGVGVTRYCTACGARVLVTDLDQEDALSDSLEQIRDLIDAGIVTLRLGGHEQRDFVDADLVIANPAVPHPWSNQYLMAAEDAGVPITTEISLLVERLPDRRHVIGVTGTAGKSTTTAMTAHALRTCEPQQVVHVGGNLGGSLLGVEVGTHDRVVLELSSAMLYWIDRTARAADREPFTPHVAVMTGFEPNHLDWHESMAHYAQSKAFIFAGLEASDFAILASGEEIWREQIDLARCVEPPIESMGPELAALMQLPGEHNLRNAITAGVAGAALATGDVGEDAVRRFAWAAASFEGLPHRLQRVGSFHGVQMFNDSKSTTPSSTRLAVEAFPDPARVHLIIGGYDKQVDLRELVDVARRCGGVYTIGAVGPALAERTGGEHCGDLARAVARAAARVREGDVLLLSPGCASWDQFRNYEERGEQFAALAAERLGVRPSSEDPGGGSCR